MEYTKILNYTAEHNEKPYNSWDIWVFENLQQSSFMFVEAENYSSALRKREEMLRAGRTIGSFKA